MLVLIYLAIMNTVCFAAFARDKRAARAGRRRIAEKRLLGLALLGGSMGALLGQHWLHHKTRKEPFRSRLLLIILLQVGLLAALVWHFRHG